MADNIDKKNKAEKTRPPVVVVLGHVDHGKTKLLDAIRKTNVVDKESGGITQHMGAYQIKINNRLITFLDTPGHEAFSAIRSRGARVADVAILVIAADESVKPQTKEAIKIIKESNIPYVVAANKIDKEGTNIQKLKQDLASEDVLVEDWGGKVPIVEISAKLGRNIEELLDMVILVSDLEDLKEDLSNPAEGVIIESHLDKRTGYIATVLVQKGVLNLGNWIVAGSASGKIKMMEDYNGQTVKEARPSQPVRIIGWSSAPEIGSDFVSTDSKKEAEKVAKAHVKDSPLFQTALKTSSNGDKKKSLNVIIKADVSSSLEAIESTITTIKSDEILCNVVDYNIGNISEGDVKMAIGSNAQIIGFRVSVNDSVKKMSEQEGIKISIFDIIYNLTDHIKKEMEDLLSPEIKRVELGRLKVLAVFKKETKYQIFGGKIVSGKLERGALGDIIRNGNKLLSGKITQLQHNKGDASEVKEGSECGLKFEIASGQQSWEVKEGDILEVYKEEKTKRTL